MFPYFPPVLCKVMLIWDVSNRGRDRGSKLPLRDHRPFPLFSWSPLHFLPHFFLAVCPPPTSWTPLLPRIHKSNYDLQRLLPPLQERGSAHPPTIKRDSAVCIGSETTLTFLRINENHKPLCSEWPQEQHTHV